MEPLIVELSGERRAIADEVVEVATLGALTPVPHAPAPLAGLTQLHGRVLPVIDLSPSPPRPPVGAPLVVVEVGPERLRAGLVVELVVGRGGGARPLDLAGALASLRRAIEAE